MFQTPPNSADPNLVSGCVGYWFLVTPATTPLVSSLKPCDAVYVTTDGAQVTGKRGAVGAGDTATQGPPLAANIPHAISFYSITAVSAGSVYALYYQNPLA